jgi:hypothetical protein
MFIQFIQVLALELLMIGYVLFIKNNPQRDWIYCYNKDADQHFFELSEDPLGIHKNKQINFCLGKKYFHRLKETKMVIKSHCIKQY